ncbi:MAG: glycerophosphodiester phosphodiesterase [Bacteroidota bacterium]
MIQRKKSGRPFVVAHRGSSGSAPENTLAAFSLAIDEGADVVELDVRMTRDFFLVVLHDGDIKRTTNGEGGVWDFTLQELRAFDAGMWYGPKFRGERVPTLRQVMELLLAHVNLNIEVKTDGEPRPRKHIAMEEACILAIMEKKFEDRTIVSSFDHDYLKRFHHLYPSIKTGALYLPSRDAAVKPSQMARGLGVSAFICSKNHLTAAMVKDAHDRNMAVAGYSINTEQELEQMLALGVDTVVTDHPKLIIKLLGK